MNKYVISVITVYGIRNLEYKYLCSNESLTETVESSLVGKKVTMRNLMKKLSQMHRMTDRKYMSQIIKHGTRPVCYKMRLAKYEKAYGREIVQRIIKY